MCYVSWEIDVHYISWEMCVMSAGRCVMLVGRCVLYQLGYHVLCQLGDVCYLLEAMCYVS